MMAHKKIESQLLKLSKSAWAVRDHARIIGKTAVGCAVLDEDGNVFVGCNIEHRFRSHDIHAEVAALSQLVSFGGKRATVVFIAAQRERFTPCGACLDWIFELGGPKCQVVTQGDPKHEPTHYSADELMPHYPI
jgi:cytidine deaminase